MHTISVHNQRLREMGPDMNPKIQSEKTGFSHVNLADKYKSQQYLHKIHISTLIKDCPSLSGLQQACNRQN